TSLGLADRRERLGRTPAKAPFCLSQRGFCFSAGGARVREEFQHGKGPISKPPLSPFKKDDGTSRELNALHRRSAVDTGSRFIEEHAPGAPRVAAGSLT